MWAKVKHIADVWGWRVFWAYMAACAIADAVMGNYLSAITGGAVLLWSWLAVRATRELNAIKRGASFNFRGVPPYLRLTDFAVEWDGKRWTSSAELLSDLTRDEVLDLKRLGGHP